MKLLGFLIVLGLGFCCILYAIFFGKIHQTLDYDNEKHIGRAILTAGLGCVASFGFIFLPVTVWPLPVIVLLVTLFSNQVVGIIASGLFSAIAVMASGQSVMVFALYFFACIVTVLVFYGIDESVHLLAPFLIQLFSLMVIETAFVCFSKGQMVEPNDFLLPAVNLVLCILLEFIVLKFFCSLVLFRDRERYLVINDTEYPLLKECKEKNKKIYMRAVHTAYLSEKIADGLEIHSPCIKTAAYYFRIGEGLQEEQVDASYYRELCKKQKFPKEATNLLLDCVEHQKHYVTREEAVVCLADSMISSLLKLFQEDSKATVDYGTMIRELFASQDKRQAFDSCDITKKELKTIESILLKETLYYDFLR